MTHINLTLASDLSLPGHADAMALAGTQYDRLVVFARDLQGHDWSRPADCTLWDVHALLAHNLGNMESNVSLRVMAHQITTAKKRAKVAGTQMIDELTALQVAERADLAPDDLVLRLAAVVGPALAGRRRVPAPLRRMVRLEAPPPLTSMTLGYLNDHVYTRYMWMYRVDICRATGRDVMVDDDHDRRVVATIVCDWAVGHGADFDLTLARPGRRVLPPGRGWGGAAARRGGVLPHCVRAQSGGGLRPAGHGRPVLNGSSRAGRCGPATARARRPRPAWAGRARRTTGGSGHRRPCAR